MMMWLSVSGLAQFSEIHKIVNLVKDIFNGCKRIKSKISDLAVKLRSQLTQRDFTITFLNEEGHNVKDSSTSVLCSVLVLA